MPMPIAPLGCFALYDNEFVLVETLTGEQRLDDQDEVMIYIGAFDQLHNAAATGSDAVGVIRHVIDELRAGSVR
jgi:hypothetical protein